VTKLYVLSDRTLIDKLVYSSLPWGRSGALLRPLGPTKTRLHRSELAVPGSNVRMLEKSPHLGADVVMLDLEDAVAPDDKKQARLNVIDALRELDFTRCSVSQRKLTKAGATRA
jgi:malate synthase